jgi:hypothetical protein
LKKNAEMRITSTAMNKLGIIQGSIGVPPKEEQPTPVKPEG